MFEQIPVKTEKNVKKYGKEGGGPVVGVDGCTNTVTIKLALRIF